MTMPHLMNCSHMCDGWCLDCVKELWDELDITQTAIRKHRDYRGDDKCWEDDEQLYSILPEGYTPPAREVAVELELCKKFIECRRNPKTEYISPQRRIEELENDVNRLNEMLRQTGYGQGQIDVYVAQCEEIDRLKAQLAMPCSHDLSTRPSQSPALEWFDEESLFD